MSHMIHADIEPIILGHIELIEFCTVPKYYHIDTVRSLSCTNRRLHQIFKEKISQWSQLIRGLYNDRRCSISPKQFRACVDFIGEPSTLELLKRCTRYLWTAQQVLTDQIMKDHCHIIIPHALIHSTESSVIHHIIHQLKQIANTPLLKLLIKQKMHNFFIVHSRDTTKQCVANFECMLKSLGDLFIIDNDNLLSLLQIAARHDHVLLLETIVDKCELTFNSDDGYFYKGPEEVCCIVVEIYYRHSIELLKYFQKKYAIEINLKAYFSLYREFFHPTFATYLLDQCAIKCQYIDKAMIDHMLSLIIIPEGKLRSYYATDHDATLTYINYLLAYAHQYKIDINYDIINSIVMIDFSNRKYDILAIRKKLNF